MSKLGQFAAACAAVVCVFGAVAGPILPLGYQEVEYLESNGKQCIETGLSVDANTFGMKMVFNTGKYVERTAYCGSSWAHSAYLFSQQGSGFCFHGSGQNLGTFVANAEAVFMTVPNGDGTATITLQLPARTNTVANVSNVCNGKLSLFGTGGSGNRVTAKLRRCVITQCTVTPGAGEDGADLVEHVVVHDFVPCYPTGNGNPGLYDIKGEKFFPMNEQSTEPFAVGPNVLYPDTLVIVSDPAGVGASTPAYGFVSDLKPGDTKPCSAPEAWTNAENTVVAVCTGYAVYVNGEETESGTDNSFTYTHPDSPTGAKLVWSWQSQVAVDVKASDPDHVTVEPSSVWVDEGADAVFSVVPAEGYRVTLVSEGTLDGTTLTVPSVATRKTVRIVVQPEATAGIVVNSAKQRYPWNGIVDIEYTISAGADPLSPLVNQIEFALTDNEAQPAERRVIADFDRVVPMTPGRHHLVWNANRNGFTFKSEDVSVTARIRQFLPKYMIVDLAGRRTDGSYPVTYALEPPEGGFTNVVYKTDKMVFRYIPPGSFMKGSPTTEWGRTADNEKQRPIAITKPFYIGIYEVTQKQYKHVTGSDPSGNKGDDRPVEKVAWTTIRGSGKWPNDKSVSDTSFAGKLRARTGIDFDLLTDTQWEYACRAGTTTPFNDGTNYAAKTEAEYKAHMNLLGRYRGNTGDGKGGYDGGTAAVGSYRPNAWGIYDMHGNVEEWVLDGSAKVADVANQTVDPVGIYNSFRVSRGGAYTYSGLKDCRSACTRGIADGSNGGNNFIGFRIGAPAK